VEHWLEHYETIGKRHEYSDEQLVEYRRYLQLVSEVNCGIVRTKNKG
jgi:hypothetical protein